MSTLTKIEKLIILIEHLVEAAQKLKNLEFESEGGYLVSLKPDLWPPEPFILSAGTIPTIEKRVSRLKNAIEKATRIWENNLTTSFEGRDEQNNKWGGGIRLNDGQEKIYAFSGFPERVDEAICIIYGTVYSYYSCSENISLSSLKSEVLANALNICPDNELVEELFDEYQKRIA